MSIDIFTFGRHRNRTFEEVAADSPSYIAWAYENVRGSGIPFELYDRCRAQDRLDRKRGSADRPKTYGPPRAVDRPRRSGDDDEGRITRYADGSGVRYDPMGSLYFDRDGNT